MKKTVHATALILFAVATIFYLLAWTTEAGFFVFLGIVVEIAAWLSLVEDPGTQSDGDRES
jgi:hypothetical protein